MATANDITMKKSIGHLVAIVASSTICDNNIAGSVSGFISPQAHSSVPKSTYATVPTGFSQLSYAPENDDIGRVSAKESADRQQRREEQQLEINRLQERFHSPVLKKHCGDLIKWKEVYGHPNIPLKYVGGKACQILRRMTIQKKLRDDEVEWLEEIGFRFHSLEDVYRFADFDKLLGRLLDYEEAHPNNNFQVPKKCPEDPELGAWVTGIRRLGKDGVKPDHERRLCEIGFVWKSTRKCGSKFMNQFREWTKEVEARGIEAVLEDHKTVAWIQAQQLALKRGTLSQTRVQYMGSLFGERWTTIGKDTDMT